MSLMRSNRLSECAAIVFLLTAAGCASAPADLANGVPWVTERHKSADASVQRLDDTPALRVDAARKAELESVSSIGQLDAARAKALDVLRQCHELAMRSTRGELDRLDDKGWTELNKRYFDHRENPDAATREQIWSAFAQDANDQYASLVAEVREADSVESIQALASRLNESIEPSIKTRGRTQRALPWLAFAGASRRAANRLHDAQERGDIDRPFVHSTRYVPVDVTTPDSELAPTDHWPLLAQFAPVIVQERAPDAAYTQDVDMFGLVEATTDDDLFVEFDRPAVYAYARDVRIRDVTYVQLVYTYWYPEQADVGGKKQQDDGAFDAPMIRVTLDEHLEPIVYESVDACGCYHRIYPTEAVVDAAASEFGEALGAGLNPVEACRPGKRNLVMGRVLENPPPPLTPVVRTTAGDHSIIDIDFSESRHIGEVSETVGYALLPYEDLERLPLPDGGYTSLFHENGLVKGAQRSYGKWFTPMGMLSAGQPRQRGTQMIQFDDWDLDDPALFEKALRWPEHPLAHPSQAASASASAQDAGN